MRAILIHLVAIFVLFIPILVKAETLSLLSQGNFDQAFRTEYMNVAKDGVGRAEDNLALGKIIFEGLGSAESNVEQGLKYLEIASEKMSLDDIRAFYWTLGLRHEELELHEMEDA